MSIMLNMVVLKAVLGASLSVILSLAKKEVGFALMVNRTLKSG